MCVCMYGHGWDGHTNEDDHIYTVIRVCCVTGVDYTYTYIYTYAHIYLY